jgi:Spy/CpxP family protein refolding chaperone
MRRKEIAMKVKGIVTILVLMLAAVALAQTPAPMPAPAPGAPQHRMGPPPGGMGMGMGMGMDMGNLMRPHMQLLAQWWKNPEVASELRLTEAQIKQLDQANMNTRLALIDAAADALKAHTRAQALLDADQLDEAAYNQQVTAISTDAANLVKTFGQMGLTIRRVLTPEQWKKLEAVRHARRAMAPARPMRPERPGQPERPSPPPSDN